MFLCFVIFVFNLDLWSISSLLLILTLYLCLHSSCFDHSKAPDLHRKASFNSNPQTYLGRYSDTFILWILTLFFSCLFLFICLFLLCAQRIPFRETTMQNGMSILCPILKLQIFFFFFFYLVSFSFAHLCHFSIDQCCFCFRCCFIALLSCSCTC